MIRLLVENSNPIGKAHEIEVVEDQLNVLANQWDTIIEEEKNKFAWWKPWTWGRKTNLVKLTNFLLVALDEFIKKVDDLVDLGEDKKATVLDAISRLYDYTVREAMPIWLKPLAGKIKNYIIYTLISTAIDWIVGKYNDGEWRDKIKPEQV